MIIIAMFVSLLLMLGLWLNTSYRDAVRRTEERAIAASKIVASNVSLLDSLARQALQRIDETLGESLTPQASATVRNINEAVADLPGQVKAYVVDEKGSTLYSTDPMVKPINIVDRPYFSDLAKGAKQHISSLLISRLNGKQIFAFSRRLERTAALPAAPSFPSRLVRFSPMSGRRWISARTPPSVSCVPMASSSRAIRSPTGRST